MNLPRFELDFHLRGGKRAEKAAEEVMIERPEEWDSLADAEALRVDVLNTPANKRERELGAALERLINEVKDNHRLFDEANNRMFADLGRVNALEGEVKKLREENARLKGIVVEVQRHRIVPESEVLEEAHVRIKQMETENQRFSEALRKIARTIPISLNREGEEALMEGYFRHKKIAKAALSALDTQEEE